MYDIKTIIFKKSVEMNCFLGKHQLELPVPQHKIIMDQSLGHE